MQNREPLLRVENLKKYFKKNKKSVVKAVDNVSFNVFPGETYSLVGESGSGKSTIAKSIIHLVEKTSGNIIFDNHNISKKGTKEDLKYLHMNMQMIFQNPMSSLNPRKNVGDIIAEGLDANHMYENKDERMDKILNIINKVGLDYSCISKYPTQFSGGQRQRIGIARALIMKPKLIIADECISALDVSVQAQVINLMKDLQEETGCAYVFITHNLYMARYISDKIGVLHLGRLVETGTTQEVFSNAIHPYTKTILSAALQANPRLEKNRELETGDYDISDEKNVERSLHLLNGSHYVLATDDEVLEWSNANKNDAHKKKKLFKICKSIKKI